MATLLNPPKGPNPAKLEEFVEKQLTAARRRIRVLDFFMAGLTLAVASLAFFLVVLLVDRRTATPPGTGWVVLAGYLALAIGFLYLMLFRPTRRDINPYFAARQVEQTVPDAKNSLVTWVDFEEDGKLPGSLRTAIGQKAARDLKGVDLNRAIENRKVLWLAIAAGLFLIANAVLFFLPPTRTEVTIEEPHKGDTTVFNNQDVAFQVRVKGRIPGPNDPDAVRLRMWYNPDDPENYEERPMKVAEDDRRKFALVVPAKQVRNGFRYKVLAGNFETPEHTVTSKIIPEFTGFEVTYEFPAYLKRAPETNNDQNLLAPYGTIATLTASTNRDVKHGHVEIEGQPRSIDGRLIDGRADAIQFTIPVEKEGAYRIWYTTPEGDKNQDPARLRLGVIDPKPVVRTFDVSYEYPAYLRFKPMIARDVREPEIEAPRGSKIVLTAKTTRGVKDAQLELPGQPAVVGELIPDQPMWVRFTLPPLEKEGTAKFTFTPTTAENPTAPRSIPVRVLMDQPPTVQIDEPKEDNVSIAANGTLPLVGLATDDHGVNKLTLFLRVKSGAEDRYLKPKPYRGGMSFLRKEDNSWPTTVAYKDAVKLPELRMEKDPNWRAAAGTVIEYWLEAEDNCAVPEPNRNVSKPKRITVLAPVMKPDEKKQIDQKNQKIDQDQKVHEKKQDAANANEKREAPQPPPPGAEQPKDGEKPEQKGADAGNNMNPPQAKAENPGGMPPPNANPMQDPRQAEIDKAIKDAADSKKPADVKPNNQPTPDAKVDPGESLPQPKTDPMAMPPEDRTPKTDPNMKPPEDGQAGSAKTGTVDKTAQDKGETKPAGEPMPGMPQETGENKPGAEFGGQKHGENKPEPKKAEPMPGVDPKPPVDKAEARKEPSKVDPKDPKSGERTEPGATKPEKDVTAGGAKPPSGEPGPMGDAPPPKDVAADKPKDRPMPGGNKPEPKKDQTADAGGSRPGPKEQDPDAGEQRGAGKPPMDGMKEEARGGSKTGPTPPSDQENPENELSREQGELAREINSSKPEVSDKAKEDVDRLMRNPETREKTRKDLEKLERNAKDQLSRKKAQDLKNRGEQAAKDYDNEKPTEENVDKLAKKLNSKDEQERKDAEQRIKDWEKDAQAKKDLEKEVDQLKKKDRSAGEKVDDAMKKAEQARKPDGTGETPKLDEKQLKDLAKDLNGQDEQAKKDAQQKLEQMGKDPKAAKDAQEKLQQMADKATGQEKKDLENAAKEAGKMADKVAQKDPPPKDQPLDPKALKEAADKLASNDQKTQQEGKDALEKMMKDPKAAQEAQDKLKEMAKNAKTDEEKKALENAGKQAEQIAKDMANKPDPKLKPEDLKDIAKKMAGDDPKEKEKAEQAMKDLMKDPKTAEQAKKMLEDMAKNGKNSPEDQKALEDAMKKADQMAKKDPPKMDPNDLKDLAKKIEQMDPKAKEEMRKKMEEAMKDPKVREEMKKKAAEMAKQPKTPQEQKQFDDLMRQLGGDFQDLGGKPDPADPRNKLKAAELTLDKFKKNITDKEFQDRLKWTPEQIDQWVKDQEATIEALRKQAEKGDWRADRKGASPVTGGIVRPELLPKDGTDTIRSGKYAPPSGYLDPYKKFTGGSEPKR